MNKPNRHNNHILETESSKFFNNQVPNEWYVDKPDHDYGVDFITNIAVNNQVTGLNFSVQLKSKEKESNINFASITLKLSTLGLFNTRLEPILLVAYVREEGEAYWVWYNDLNLDLTNKKNTITINIPKTNRLSTIIWNDILKYVQNTFSIKKLIDGIKFLEYDEISNIEILAWKHYYTSDYEKASFYFKNLLKNNPKDIVIVLEGLAHSQYMSFNYLEALQNINTVIEISGTEKQFLTKACILAEDGIAKGNRGKIIEAKNIFRKFIKENPTQEQYHFNFANTLKYLGETSESIKHYKISLKLNSNNAEVWKNLGSVYYDIHEHDKEIECYNKALEISPTLPQALFSKGITISHIYNRNQEGLTLMLKSIENEKDMMLHFPHGFFWLAYVNEKLNNLDDSLYYINKGLSINPEDIYMLNFKSDFLASNWKVNEKIKEESINFFEYRLELENDSKSLYYLIKINNISDNQAILDLIKKHFQILRVSSLNTFEKCSLNIADFLNFLLNYDKYLEMRYSNPINRYIDHFISEYYSISSEFLEIIDLIFANSFSNAVAEYSQNNDFRIIGQKILNDLSILPNGIFELIPDENFTQEVAISIMSNIYTEYPTIAIREYALQNGFIAGKLSLEKPNVEEILTEEWLCDLQEKTFLKINQKLKLLKEE